MTLTNLIQKLKTASEGEEPNLRKLNSLVAGKIEFPEYFDSNAESDRGIREGFRTDVPHLAVSFFAQRTEDEVQPTLDGLFSRAKSVRLHKGTAKVKYKVLWTPESFQEERRLEGLFFDEVKVESTAYNYDSTQNRLVTQCQGHIIEATTKGNRMTLNAKGEYRRELRGIIERYGPQFANLNLSKDDAERLLRVISRCSNSELLKRVLRPEKRKVLSISQDTGISFGEREVIEITIQTRDLPKYEEAIGKPLIDSNKESRVTKLVKIYGLGAILRGERLSDLQSIAREIPNMDLGIIYGHPMVTNIDARRMLDEEIELIDRGYKEMFLFGPNAHMIRGGIVKRLAIEHFGEEVVNNFDKLEVNDYINFLKARGYVEPRAEDVEDEEDREFYARLRAKGEIENRAFSAEPDYQQKERHLLEFFKQSYAQDPKDSIQGLRKHYQNEPPKVTISATSRKDASRLSRLKLPSRSKLCEFGIEEHLGAEHQNSLSITRSGFSDEGIHFYLRTSVDSPTLLELQEYACSQIGVRFN